MGHATMEHIDIMVNVYLQVHQVVAMEDHHQAEDQAPMLQSVQLKLPEAPPIFFR